MSDEGTGYLHTPPTGPFPEPPSDVPDPRIDTRIVADAARDRQVQFIAQQSGWDQWAVVGHVVKAYLRAARDAGADAVLTESGESVRIEEPFLDETGCEMGERGPWSDEMLRFQPLVHVVPLDGDDDG